MYSGMTPKRRRAAVSSTWDNASSTTLTTMTRFTSRGAERTSARSASPEFSCARRAHAALPTVAQGGPLDARIADVD